jgi:hypothetical protein
MGYLKKTNAQIKLNNKTKNINKKVDPSFSTTKTPEILT